MNGMATISDVVLQNLTTALKDRGMWNNTLLIQMSDNGGPAGLSGNNYPLRGGKMTNFEGGVRVVGFMTGGFLASHTNRTPGEQLTGYVHLADWYPTLCSLAGIDSADPNPHDPSLPGVDGMDMWPYISGKVATSPRNEIMLGSGKNGGIIVGDLKLILGMQKYGFRTGPVYPNASTDHSSETAFDCGSGCLFNISGDPGEYNDLAASRPDDLRHLHALWQTRSATKFGHPQVKKHKARCIAYVKAHSGFVGPYMDWESLARALCPIVWLSAALLMASASTSLL
jgi:arylsulfatase I/J